MTRMAGLLALALAVLVGSIAARAQFETPNRAFHGNTVFPLTGRHQTVACESCHLKGVFKGTPTACYDCHWVRRQDDKFRTQLGTRCETCHRTISWAAVRWDHGAMTSMPLSGAHRTLGCESCHTNNRFETASVSCIGCHQDDYAATTSPNHASAGFPTACEACHKPSDVAFSQARFDHNASFPLAGRHGAVTCVACHRNNVFQGTPRDCVGCHKADYDRAVTPNHASAGFPTTCESCHRTTDVGWKNGSSGFSHSQFFTLVGTHQLQTCAACHRNNVYKGTPRDCAGCHLPRYQQTSRPNHAQSGFPTTCENCHRPTDANWTNGTFTHASVFPLAGRHATIDCAACHTGNVYKGTARDCVGCHRTQYDRTTAPNHAQAGFSTQCDSCHRASDSTWTGVTFNHGQFFALQGVHASQACATCHRNGVYKGTPRTCVGCHQARYDATRNPNHAQSGFPTTCDSCHRATDTSWTQGRFTHTRFPLTGKHNVACAQCHTSPPPAFNCLNCHARAKTDDQHKGRSGYRYDSAACYACHPNGRSD